MLLATVAGGASPHRSSIRRSVATTSPACSRSSASSARCFVPPSTSERPCSTTSSGPRSRKSMRRRQSRRPRGAASTRHHPRRLPRGAEAAPRSTAPARSRRGGVMIVTPAAPHRRSRRVARRARRSTSPPGSRSCARRTPVNETRTVVPAQDLRSPDVRAPRPCTPRLAVSPGGRDGRPGALRVGRRRLVRRHDRAWLSRRSCAAGSMRRARRDGVATAAARLTRGWRRGIGL